MYINMIDTVNSIRMATYKEKSDPIWIEDYNILIRKDKLYDFFPTKSQTNEERINSIVRLSFYISVVLLIYHSNIKYSSIFVFFIFFTFIIYKHHPEINSKTVELNKIDLSTQQRIQMETEDLANSPKNKTSLNNFTPSLGLKKTTQEKVIEKFEGEKYDNKDEFTCTEPTLDNPFMNATMKDYMNFDKDGSIVNRTAACDPNEPDIKAKIETNFNNNLFRDVNDVFGRSNSQRQFFTMPYTTIPNDRESFQSWLYLSPATCKENQDHCLNFEDLRGKPFMMPNEFRNPNSAGARDKENTNQKASDAPIAINKK